MLVLLFGKKKIRYVKVDKFFVNLVQSQRYCKKFVYMDRWPNDREYYTLSIYTAIKRFALQSITAIKMDQRMRVFWDDRHQRYWQGIFDKALPELYKNNTYISNSLETLKRKVFRTDGISISHLFGALPEICRFLIISRRKFQV